MTNKEQILLEIRKVRTDISELIEAKEELENVRAMVLINDCLYEEDLVDEIEIKIGEIIEKEHKLRHQLDGLKRKYYQTESVEYFKPMDFEDICRVIHNNGSIKCIKL